MRVCNKHFKPATEILESKKTGEEFDLCPECEMELREILHGKQPEPAPEPESPRIAGPIRSPGRPKKKVS